MIHAAINTIRTKDYTQKTFTQSIGFLTLALPLILVIGNFVFFSDSKIQPSISHYYYTDMNYFFVGSLSIFAVFMLLGETKTSGENLWSKIAGIGALGTVCCPTMPVGGKLNWVNVLHLVFALTLFLAISVLSITHYIKAERRSADHLTFRSRVRALAYRLSGYGILISLVALVLYFVIVVSSGGTTVNSITVFVIEAVMIGLVGLIWLIKGEFIVKPTQLS